MPTETDLRQQLRDEPGPDGRIDVGTVLHRARARRRPRVVLTTAISALAVIGIAVPVTLTIASPHLGGSVAGSAAGSATRPLEGAGAPPAAQSLDGAAAESLNRCGAPVVELPAAADGLVLTVAPAEAESGAEQVTIHVTMTNTSAVGLSGSTAASPAVTLSSDGTVLWHSNGPVPPIAVPVELAPGQSMSYDATLEPAICSEADETSDGFRSNLPAAGPGLYQLSAAIAFLPEGTAAPVLVGSPDATLTLH